MAAVLVGLVQQYTNYYESGVGDLAVLLLAATLLVRPGGLAEVGAGPLTAVRRVVVPLAVLAALVLVPRARRHARSSSDLDSPGSLQLLGLCLVFGAVALCTTSPRLTGLLSFGHALYFAISLRLQHRPDALGWSFWQALLLTAAVGLAVPLVLGSISLRVTGIAFAMVTLAFAQAGNVLVHKNPEQ